MRKAVRAGAVGQFCRRLVLLGPAVQQRYGYISGVGTVFDRTADGVLIRRPLGVEDGVFADADIVRTSGVVRSRAVSLRVPAGERISRLRGKAQVRFWLHRRRNTHWPLFGYPYFS